MIITLKGQLQAMAGTSQIEAGVESSDTLRSLIQRVGNDTPDAARALILDDAGEWCPGRRPGAIHRDCRSRTGEPA